MRLEGLSTAAARPRPTDTPAPPQSPAISRNIIEPRQELSRWVDTGVSLSQLVEGVPLRVSAGAIGAFLVRRGDQVVGMSAYCTHLPCELNWVAGAQQFNCPCHNVDFDSDGFQVTSPEAYPLPPLPHLEVRMSPTGRVEVGAT